jgi:anaerobic selenocysteine-containing dehydrogenase
MILLYGTNNFPDCSNMCHEPTSVGLPESIGIGKGTVVLDDFEHADAIFILGQRRARPRPNDCTLPAAASESSARAGRSWPTFRGSSSRRR